MKIILTFALSLTIHSSFALSCVRPNLKDFVARPFVTEVKILSKDKGGYETEVVKRYKGESKNKKMRVLVREWVWAPKFTIGKTYIIFSHKEDEHKASGCGLFYRGDDEKAKEKLMEALKK